MRRNQNVFRMLLVVITCSTMIVGGAPTASARTLLRNICRVKGQEENVLRGLGLVVGLNGTGEANDPQTMRALSRAMEVMGSPIPQTGLPGQGGVSERFKIQGSLAELKKIKNVALVWVTATVPATGARRGDKLDCRVSAINGKSLAGGQLTFAALKGPNVQDESVYALAEGLIHLENSDQPLTGTIHNGCQMEADVYTPFVDENGYITLILERNHANFQTASDIAGIIRQTYFQGKEEDIKALNASNINMKVPEIYMNDPVDFISSLLDMQSYTPEPEARVVINERTGSIVISGDVQIGDVVVSHKNIVVDATVQVPPFAKLDPRDGGDSAKLTALVDALNTLKVPNADAIDIIKNIARSGKLHGRLIIE
jgi:flagellar P-ring protein precursor FlgI